MYTRVEKMQVILTQVWLGHGGIKGSIAHQKGALLTIFTASWGGKRKKAKPSTAEESKPIEWTWTYTAN